MPPRRRKAALASKNSKDETDTIKVDSSNVSDKDVVKNEDEKPVKIPLRRGRKRKEDSSGTITADIPIKKEKSIVKAAASASKNSKDEEDNIKVDSSNVSDKAVIKSEDEKPVKIPLRRGRKRKEESSGTITADIPIKKEKSIAAASAGKNSKDEAKKIKVESSSDQAALKDVDEKPVEIPLRRGRKRKEESSGSITADIPIKKEKSIAAASAGKNSKDEAKKIKVESSSDQAAVKDKNEKPVKIPLRRGRRRKDESSATITSDIPIKKEKTAVKEEPETSKSSAEEEKVELKKITFTGKIPVDEHCEQCSTGYHVYSEPPNNAFNMMLNQTNIGFNNNKYYLLQLLKHNTSPKYFVWFRWGRVGKIAGSACKGFGSNVDSAKNTFYKKFHDKTKNDWAFRSSFTKVQGKYDMLEMDYGEDQKDDKENEKKEQEKKEKKNKIKSLLDERVGNLIDLIFDLKEFEASIKEMEFDVKKAPLGKLRSKQIKAGYESLKKIETCIQKNDLGRKLADACSEFYTRIPHDFGMKCPPLIRTSAELKKKIQLLEALSDIQIAIQLIDEEKEEDLHPKDTHYNSLGCKLEAYDSEHPDFKMVKEYVDTTHGSTHGQYVLDVENVFKIGREEDEKRFKKHLGNRMLLWHGSRLTNWCGILKQGLRIAPPEAPVTGYMFGKGVYFADMVTKSANYCFANSRQPVGLLVLCEVALGNMCEKYNADYNAGNLPDGKHSTKGVGRETPNDFKTLECGTLVPMGKKKKVEKDNKSLQYNEYIVYDVAQVQPRFLVQTRFKFQNLW